MPDQDLICPNCAYSLQGHTPINQADPEANPSITCPECGRPTSYNLAITAPPPKKRPIFTVIFTCFIIIAFFGACTLLGRYIDFFLWLIY